MLAHEVNDETKHIPETYLFGKGVVWCVFLWVWFGVGCLCVSPQVTKKSSICALQGNILSKMAPDYFAVWLVYSSYFVSLMVVTEGLNNLTW